MAEILGDLVVRVGGDTEAFQSAMHRAKVSLTDFAGSARSATSDVAKIGAGAAVAAAVGFAALIKHTMDTVDAQAKLAARMETTSASIANLKQAAALSGVEFGRVEASSEFLSKTLSQASEAGSAAAETFDRLKLSAAELQAMPLDQRIATINQALIDNVDASSRAAVAAEIYGAKAGSAMRLLTPDAIAQASDQVTKLGLAITDIDAAKIEQAGDAIESASKVFDGFLQQMTAELAPIITAIADQFFNAATSVEGFGTAGKTAAEGMVDGIAFVIDAVEGVRRSFDVLGKGLAVVGLGFEEIGLMAVEWIANRPIEAVNELIAALNKIPGVELEPISLSEFGQGVKDDLTTVRGAIALGIEDINTELMKPMPSGQFKQFVADAKVAAQEAAVAKVELDKVLRADGSGQDSGDPAQNEKKTKEKEKDDKAKQKSNDDLLERVNAVREANATELELVAQKEAKELATLQESRAAKLISEQDYQALKAETQARFAEDRLSAIRDAGKTQLDLLAETQAEEMAQLQAARDSDLISAQEYEKLKAETEARFREDRIGGIMDANKSELDILRAKQAEEMAQLQATRDANLISETEFQTLKAETEARFREERLGGIMDANASELEIMQEKQALELEALQTSFADKLLSEQEYEAMRIETMARFAEQAVDIKKREEEAKTRLQKEQEEARRAALGTALGDLSTLMNSGSRKMFEVGKAAAIAQTVMSTYEGAQKAYSALAGIPIVGPGLGIAAAGAAIAAGTARVQSIRSQKFGAGASTPTGSNTGQVNAGGQPVTGSSGGSVESRQTMYIQGVDKNSLYSGDQMISMINEAQKNGARLVLL